METVAEEAVSRNKERGMHCIPLSLFRTGELYLKRSLIFDQLVGGFGVTMVFLPKLTDCDCEEILSESLVETGTCENENTARARIANVATTFFFIVHSPSTTTFFSTHNITPLRRKCKKK
jgi:hypothetical protein